MTKTVFARNDMVAHVWGQQTQDEGRSPTPRGGGRFGFSSGASSADESRVSFKGPVFYSYREPVARLVEQRGKTGLALLVTAGQIWDRDSEGRPNYRPWSPSTSGHVGSAVSATSHLHGGHVYTVPDIGGHYGSPGEWHGEPRAIDHVGNLEHLARVYRDRLALYEGRAKIRREYVPGIDYMETIDNPDARYFSEADTVRRGLREVWVRIGDYADSFVDPADVPVSLAGLPRTFKEVDAVAAAVMAEREARAARALAKLTPKEIARRAAAKAERAEKAERARKLQYADAAEKLAGWRDGLRIGYGLPHSDGDGRAYVRATGVKRDKAGEITGGTLETSQGASAPLVAAIRVFRLIKCVQDSGRVWQAGNGRDIRVGHFTVNRIEPTGDFVAGCHRFAWPEILALAERLGVAFLPCDRAAFREIISMESAV